MSVFFSNASSNPIIAVAGVVVNPFIGHYCYKWLSGLTLVYSYTEDSDGNGKIDRIRIQAAAGIGGTTSGFTASVSGYTVTGYNFTPGSDILYILLKEQGYNDTGATPGWTILNTTLKDSATGTQFAVTYTDPAPMFPVDTAPPRIGYSLALPASGPSSQVFVHMSEPVYNSGGAINFAGGYPDPAPATITSVAGGITEFMLTGGPLSTLTLANGATTTTIANDVDGGVPAIDLSIGTPSLPKPKYPVDMVYSSYAVGGLVPPYVPTAAGATHRVSDVLVNEPVVLAADSTYFMWPIYAKDSVKLTLSDAGIEALSPAQTASQGIGLIRAFDGSQWLRAQDISLQARMQPAPAFTGAFTGAKLWFDSNVSADLTSPYGLWLPSFSETGFSGLAAYPDASPWGRGASVATGVSAGSGLFNFTLPVSDPRVSSISKFDFFFTFVPAVGGEPLYSARLDMLAGAAIPADWYRRVKPFSFSVHNVSLQKGGATILNNVIDPTKGELARLSYQLPQEGAVTITVFTLDGDVVARLANERKAAGDYTVTWNGRNLGGSPVARGMYFVRIVAPNIDEIRKVIVVRK